jgi:hypothetical protein
MKIGLASKLRRVADVWGRTFRRQQPRRRYPVTGHLNPFVVRRALLRQAVLELKGSGNFMW